MGQDTFTTAVQTLQIGVVASLIFLAGLSSCLSLWVIPLTKLLPPKLAARQFQQTFVWGGQYLLPSSRTLSASLLLTTILNSQLPSPTQSEQWKYWAGCFFTLILVAPYEIYFIFPINDRVEEIGKELERGVRREEEHKRELQELLAKWQFRNFGRVAWPFVVGVAGLLCIVKR